MAITDGTADLFDVRIGASLALDGVPRPVVGIVENPGNLADEFVLVPPSQTGAADDVTILVDTSDDQARTFGSRVAPASTSHHARATNVIAAVSVLVVATVGLLLVALIAAASFVVIAHRRCAIWGCSPRSALPTSNSAS